MLPVGGPRSRQQGREQCGSERLVKRKPQCIIIHIRNPPPPPKTFQWLPKALWTQDEEIPM